MPDENRPEDVDLGLKADIMTIAAVKNIEEDFGPRIKSVKDLRPHDNQEDVMSLGAELTEGVIEKTRAGRKKKDKGPKLSRKEKRELAQGVADEMRAARANSRKTKKEMDKVKRGSKRKANPLARLGNVDKNLKFKLTKAQKEHIAAIDPLCLIGYDTMYADGVCHVRDGLYSETVHFEDISYQSAHDDGQKTVFKAMGNMIQFCGANSSLQYNITNKTIPADEIGNREFFNPESQGSEELVRAAVEYNKVLNAKVKEGVSNIRQERYLTYTVDAKNKERAVQALASVRTKVMGTLSEIKAESKKLDGTERLELLSSLLRPGQHFDGASVAVALNNEDGTTNKSFISPQEMDFGLDPSGTYFKIDGRFAQILVIRKFGTDIYDNTVSDIVDLPIPMNMSWHLQGLDKYQGEVMVRRSIAFIDNDISKFRKRNGIFASLPSNLEYSKKEADKVLSDIQEKGQRLYLFTGVVYTYADTLEDLEQQVLDIAMKGQEKGLSLETYDLRQREGLMSVLPIGDVYTEINRVLTTAQAAMIMPFSTQEIEDINGIYFGQNRESHNLVLFDRTALASPMGFVCGPTGSGKSFWVKQLSVQTRLKFPSDQLIIIDRKDEYRYITEYLGGEAIELSASSGKYLNMMDMASLEHMNVANQMAWKQDAFLTQATAMANQNGVNLDEGEQSIITRCVEQAYEAARLMGETPVLSHFYKALKSQPELEAARVALRYERYITGGQGFLDHPRNVSLDNKVIDFIIKDLPDSMVVFAMINVCETIRNIMYQNAALGIRTHVILEETKSLFQYPAVVKYFSRFANEGRAFGLALLPVTQIATDMLSSPDAKDMVLNSGYIYLLKQSIEDRIAWANLLKLSEVECGYIDEGTKRGDGLLIVGHKRVPIEGNFPESSYLYDVYNTEFGHDEP